MAADKLTPAIVKDIAPNLNIMMKLFTATSDDTADYVDMADYGFTTLYMAMAVDVTSNAAVVSEISGTTVVLTGTTGETTVLVVGI